MTMLRQHALPSHRTAVQTASVIRVSYSHSRVTISGPDFDEATERLLQEGRPSAPLRPRGREAVAELLVGAAFLVSAIAMALLLPTQGPFRPGLAAAFALALAVVTRVRFDVGAGYTVPTQLLLVPMLFELPARTVPLVVAFGLLLGDLPDYLTRRRHPARTILALGDSWFAIGPALVFAVAEIDGPDWSDWPIYVGALGAQLACDIGASIASLSLGRGVKPSVQLGVLGWVHLIDVLLAPVGLLAAFASTRGRYAFLLLLPLASVFVIFARERRARIENALGLSKAYQETAELNARLLETERVANRAREELIAGASHDMQTPLAVLIGLIDALAAEGQLSAERQVEVHQTMRRQAHLLQHLVRQFVDYTRLKADRRLAFHPQAAHVEPIVEHVAAIQTEHDPIEVEVADELPRALVDPDRLRQVLMNLVSNALKFSPPGVPPRITVRSGQDAIEIAVVDRGRGMGTEEQAHLFEEFHRGVAESGPGSGIGLYLSRMLMDPQGVRILVESEPGTGSTFTLVIPRADLEARGTKEEVP
jgi:signal transduction histidine kinase